MEDRDVDVVYNGFKEASGAIEASAANAKRKRRRRKGDDKNSSGKRLTKSRKDASLYPSVFANPHFPR